MLVIEALTEIRNKINDRDEVGLDTSELLSYLNEAVQYVSAALITYGSTDLIIEQIINEETAVLPVNFARFCGNYPVKQTGKRIELLDEPPLKIRYFASIPLLTGSDIEEMPFNHIALTQFAIKLACVYANAQQKLDVSTDKALAQELAQIVATSMGANVANT